MNKVFLIVISLIMISGSVWAQCPNTRPAWCDEDVAFTGDFTLTGDITASGAITCDTLDVGGAATGNGATAVGDNFVWDNDAGNEMLELDVDGDSNVAADDNEGLINILSNVGMGIDANSIVGLSITETNIDDQSLSYGIKLIFHEEGDHTSNFHEMFGKHTIVRWIGAAGGSTPVANLFYGYGNYMNLRLKGIDANADFTNAYWFANESVVALDTANHASAEHEFDMIVHYHVGPGAEGANGKIDVTDYRGFYYEDVTVDFQGNLDTAGTQTAIWVNDLSGGFVNHSIVLDGDGVNNDIMFGAGQDDNIYHDGTNLVLNPAAAVSVSGELIVSGVSGSGKVVCVKADSNFGVCSDAPAGDGTCTCG